MNTRHPTPCLTIAVSILLLLPLRSNVAAEEPETLPFLKVGSTYLLTAGAALPHTVKILGSAGGQWFRVEYHDYVKSIPPTVGSPSTPLDPTPREMWINFANVAGVKESKEPDKKEPEKK